jgi:spermidine/putrescine transport system permease protein
MRRTSPALAAFSWLVYGFLYLPILVLIVFSFNNSRFGATWEGFTLKWYGVLFGRDDVREALVNTLLVAVPSTILSTVLGTLLGFGLWRYAGRWRTPLTFLMVVPIVIPDVVMGVGLLMLYALVRTVAPFSNGLVTVLLAHVTFQISYVALTVRSRLAGYDRSLEEAARDLGASSLRVFTAVVLPLALPGILTGALLAFTLSLDDFVVTYFTSGSGFRTLPVLIYTNVKRGITPDINALSALLVGVTAIGLVLASVISARSARRSGEDS